MIGHKFLAFFAVLLAIPGWADGPKDNNPEEVRRIPPAGIAVPEESAVALRSGLEKLGSEIESLKKEFDGDPEWLALIPDVEVYHKAVRYALEFREFQKESELRTAGAHLETALGRAARLRERQAPWLRETGLVVRGFRSKIDGTVQPYGLEIPSTYDFDGASKYRLDFWFHGRGERTNEVAFIQQREKGSGKISPENTIVLHPYARFSNANKFAGEIDCLEALDHAARYLRIDEDRTFVRGFSMGGAACWQFAVHYADRWAGATPGAGFSETPEFLRTFQGETLDPAPWEKRLWHWYDCTDWAVNLSHCPTIAYSGELDTQKQAADMMEKACADVGLRLVHLIGPGTKHAIHPDSLEEIEKRLSSIARTGRERVPGLVRFKTYTLRYDRMHWIRIEGMTEHWEPAQIEAEIIPPNRIQVKTEGVESFSMNFNSGDCPLDLGQKPVVEIDGRPLECPRVGTDRSWSISFRKAADSWKFRHPKADTDHPRKRHGLTGPIDDAFMDSFLMVKPSGDFRNAGVKSWTEAEFAHAVTHWRQQMRGDVRVRMDHEVTADDIANHNLVLWGDPESNSLLKRVVGGLPIEWTKREIKLGDQRFDAGKHTVALIYPNPLNPERYVVLNSSFTYREYDYLNNARQTPKLPDWAVIDFTQPVTSQRPGGIPAAGFFGEKWEVK